MGCPSAENGFPKPQEKPLGRRLFLADSRLWRKIRAMATNQTVGEFSQTASANDWTELERRFFSPAPPALGGPPPPAPTLRVLGGLSFPREPGPPLRRRAAPRS